MKTHLNITTKTAEELQYLQERIFNIGSLLATGGYLPNDKEREDKHRKNWWSPEHLSIINLNPSNKDTLVYLSDIKETSITLEFYPKSRFSEVIIDVIAFTLSDEITSGKINILKK